MPKGKLLNPVTLIFFLHSNTHTSSRNYTGKGTANYPNGDSYTGDFKDGVSRDFVNERLML